MSEPVKLDIPGLTEDVTVTARHMFDGQIIATAELRLYGVCCARNENELPRAAHTAVKWVKEYARWGRDIGDVVEVAPHLLTRISFHGRTGTVIQRDLSHRTALVRWDDGAETELPFTAFASNDMELAK